MKKLLILFVGLALLGAGCGLSPLSPSEPQSDFEKRLAPKNKEGQTMEDKDQEEMNDAKDDTDENNMDKAKDTESSKEDMSDSEEVTIEGLDLMNEVSMEADDASIVAMFYASKADYEGNDAYAEFGCSEVLVPVRVELEKQQSDLAEAVVSLLTTKSDDLSDGLMNAVRGTGLALTNVRYSDEGARVLEFEGELKLGGVCDAPRVKSQIEETVRLYSDSFEIQLNGSTKEWECAFDESGEC